MIGINILGILMIAMFALSCGMSSFCSTLGSKIKEGAKQKTLLFFSRTLLTELILFTVISLVVIINFGAIQQEHVKKETGLKDSIKTLEGKIDKIIESGKNDTITLDGQQIMFTFYEE